MVSDTHTQESVRWKLPDLVPLHACLPSQAYTR